MAPSVDDFATLDSPNRLIARADAVISEERVKAYRIYGGIAAAIFLVACVLLIATGPTIQRRYGHDTPLLLDGAWKVYWGNKPHHDFYCPFGAFDFMLLALGLKIAGLTAKAIPVANTIFAAALAATTWWSCRKRLSAPLLFLFTLAVGFVALSAHQLRFAYWETTYTTFYNRHGYALLVLLAVLLYVPRRGDSGPRPFADGALIGAICVLMFFIKITFSLVAGAFIACLLLARPPGRRWIVGMLAGAAVTAFAFLAYLHFDAVAVLNDFGIAAAARRGTLALRAPFMHLLALDYQLAFLAVMALLLLLSPAFVRPASLRVRLAQLLIALAFVGCSVFLAATNAPDGEIPEVPLLIAPAVILMQLSANLRRGNGAAGAVSAMQGARAMHVILLLIGAFVIAPLLLRDATSVAYAVASSVVKGPHFGSAERFNTPTMSSMVFTGVTGEPHYPGYGTTYAEKVNEGLKLLGDHVSPAARIDSFDFTNPFPFASARPPNGGSPIAWQAGFTVSAKRYPDADRTFRNADAIMIPKYPGNPGAPQLLLEIYADYLRQNFVLRAESHHWFLLSRRTDVPAEPGLDLKAISDAIATDYEELHGTWGYSLWR